uniref:Uncharacterized protein n=1 Tax=Babesia bovis TaxID=5865 RepID=S6BG27_BABBO|nr:hypothetical protein [Babesia bovis]
MIVTTPRFPLSTWCTQLAGLSRRHWHLRKNTAQKYNPLVSISRSVLDMSMSA